jgi:tripartite-type tricarboxylate transporter receptor subunit TctC
MAELGYPDVHSNSFVGIMAPARTPAAIVTRLNAAIAALSKDKDFVERLAALGMSPTNSTPEQFGAFIQEQVAKWGAVAKTAQASAK